MRRLLKLSGLIYRTGLFFILLIVVYLGYTIFLPNRLPNNLPYQLVIDKEQSIRGVAKKLDQDGIIKSPQVMIFVTRLMGKDKKVTAGLYMFKQPMSILDIVKRITNGKPDEISITLIEGWTFKQIRAYIDSLPEITHLTTSMSESQILSNLKITYPRMEGLLYPSTYFIAPKQTDLEIYHSAYNLMQDKLQKIWLAKNINASNYPNPYALLTMASLIQKETSDNQDMFQISTVFNNRLRNGMRLQDDPAVFYGLNNREKIIREDFQTDTPYNTYLHNGLPPTPICTPSQNALQAAATPGDDYKLLYFIAIGKGKSKFSYTFQEHTSAVNKYLKKPIAKNEVRKK